MNWFETASGLALRHLSPRKFTLLRNLYRSSRIRLDPLVSLVHGSFDIADLKEHLDQRVGKDFEILMVHSSVNHMKPMYTDGPLELVRMLMAFCGPDRTLAMPAFFFGNPRIGGAYATMKQDPRFDLRRTPSQMGLATELFRRSKGVIQSRHPVYRISAVGPLAEAMTRDHEKADSPCGTGSPFDFMVKHNTLILGIGKPFEVLTQVHHAEHVLGDEFPVPGITSEPLAVTLVDGEQEIPFTLQGHSFQWRRNMWRLRDIMDQKKLREWRFHHVPLFATRADQVTASLVDAAKRGVTLYEKP